MSNRVTSHTTESPASVLWLALPLAALAALALGAPLTATAVATATAWFALTTYGVFTRRRKQAVRTPPGVTDSES